MNTIKNEKIYFFSFILFIGALYFLGPILPPFLIAFIIAYLGIPVVSRLTRWGIPPLLSACIVFLIFLFLMSLILILFIPVLERELIQFYNKIPIILNWLQQILLPWINQHFDLQETVPLDYLKKTVSQNIQQTGNIVMTVWKAISHSSEIILEWLMTCLLVPVVTFYLLRDWDHVWHNLQDFLPHSIRKQSISFFKECNEVLGAFFRGQLIVIVALGAIYSVGLSVAGLDSALLVGLFSGLINIVPYLGLIVGMIIASIMMFIQYHDLLHVAYAVIVFLIGSGIDNTVLTPNLIGSRIGLHPVAVIFAVLAGGHLFGFVGILLALPIASLIMVLLRHVKMASF